MYQFFDTETSGLFDFKAPATAKHQPHVAQIGMVLTDENFNIKAKWDTLIEPVDAAGIPWEMDEEAQKIHGISVEDCKAFGIPIRTAMVLMRDYRRCAQVHVAYNEKFDRGMIEAETHRLGGNSFLGGARFCPMLALTPILKIPGPYGFKWPKLAEAYKWATDGGVMEKAHDAMADILATVTVVKAIKEREPQLLKGLV